MHRDKSTSPITRSHMILRPEGLSLLSGLWKRALPGSSGPASEEIQAGYREIQEVESAEER
jgi:hypothetical protein